MELQVKGEVIHLPLTLKRGARPNLSMTA